MLLTGEYRYGSHGWRHISLDHRRSDPTGRERGYTGYGQEVRYRQRVDSTASQTALPGASQHDATTGLEQGPRLAFINEGLVLDLDCDRFGTTGSHDEVYLTDLERGQASVINPRLRLAFTLTWDASLFGCIAMWQPYGGLDISPWAGSYGVGMEPWVTCSNLAGALSSGKSIQLGPNKSLATSLTAKITETR